MRTRLPTGSAVPVLFALAALITFVHAEGHVAHALGHSSARAWLDGLYGVMRTAVAVAFAVFTIGRAAPRRPSRSPVAFAACAVAMGPIAVFGYPPPQAPDVVVLIGDLIAVVFCVWLLFAVLFLGRCFGVLPAARGLVTRGPYGVVRHPVYLGEIGAFVGLAIAAPTVGNGILLLVFAFGQALRMRYEEAALREAFPEYEDYARRVPRVLPSPRRLARPRRTRAALSLRSAEASNANGVARSTVPAASSPR
jgi:protein-S-isoprenylcysteine O-methyltransferase Ste14